MFPVGPTENDSPCSLEAWCDGSRKASPKLGAASPCCGLFVATLEERKGVADPFLNHRGTRRLYSR